MSKKCKFFDFPSTVNIFSSLTTIKGLLSKHSFWNLEILWIRLNRLKRATFIKRISALTISFANQKRWYAKWKTLQLISPNYWNHVDEETQTLYFRDLFTTVYLGHTMEQNCCLYFWNMRHYFTREFWRYTCPGGGKEFTFQDRF